MQKCKTCKHWSQSTNWDYKGAINDGICLRLPGDKMIIKLRTGWDGGYVDLIETEEDFGCTLHEKK